MEDVTFQTPHENGRILEHWHLRSRGHFLRNLQWKRVEAEGRWWSQGAKELKMQNWRKFTKIELAMRVVQNITQLKKKNLVRLISFESHASPVCSRPKQPLLFGLQQADAVYINPLKLATNPLACWIQGIPRCWQKPFFAGFSPLKTESYQCCFRKYGNHKYVAYMYMINIMLWYMCNRDGTGKRAPSRPGAASGLQDVHLRRICSEP